MRPLLRCDGVAKRFGGACIFEDFAYEWRPGTVALTGRNGVGKSTLLALLAGVLPPDRGTIWVAEHDLAREPVQAKRRLGYAPDRPDVYSFLTGGEFLSFVTAAKGALDAAPVASSVEQLGLTAHLDQRFDKMSLGTRRKFMLVAAFIGDPAVVLLDEPANALDFAARETLAQWLREYGRGERLILFSSHDRRFIEDVGAAVIRLHDGRISAAGAEGLEP